jgi:hypothetical protein
MRNSRLFDVLRGISGALMSPQIVMKVFAKASDRQERKH